MIAAKTSASQNTAAIDAAQLRSWSRDRLMTAMMSGHPIDPDELDNVDYRGVSLGLGATLERLTWTTFVKSFRRDPRTGQLHGWNTRIDQRDPYAYRPMLRRGKRIEFGPFAVVPADDYKMPRPCHRGLMLDYGKRCSRWSPLSLLRDPIVAVRAGDASLLLGWSYLSIGSVAVSTPSFFSLERPASKWRHTTM